MPISVRIPTPLRKLTDGQAAVEIDGGSIRELFDNLENRHAGFKEKIFDDSGDVRRFINLYVNGDDVRSLEGADTALKDGDELSIVPAIAGGCSASSRGESPRA